MAWGAFYFGGKHDGKLYSHCPTELQIKEYIGVVHQSNDSLTLRHGPLYATPQPEGTATDQLTTDQRTDLLAAALFIAGRNEPGAMLKDENAERIADLLTELSGFDLAGIHPATLEGKAK